MTQHSLHVFDAHRHIGELGFDTEEDRFSFEYSPTWLTHPGRYPLSPHLPLTGSIGPNTVRRFLQNLLPEGRALDAAATFASISKNNVFALLQLLGQETVGALTFQATDMPPEAQPAVEREIAHAELAERIRDRNHESFTIWDSRVRPAIAGYQDKLSVMMRDDRLFLVEGSLASTHILKPESQNPAFPHLVANEHFCMTLAARLGLPVAPVQILRIPDAVLLIERFDRQVEAGQIRRRHILDGCQALDMTVDAKYERMWGDGPETRNIREGVSFEKLFSLRDRFVNEDQAQLLMLRWALLQLILGNGDAHGKNLSFFIDQAGLSVAPFYDLVSTVQYDGSKITHSFALGFGDAFTTGELGAFQLADFAQLTQMDRRLIQREAARLARVVAKEAPELAKSGVYLAEEQTLVDQIANDAVAQSARLAKVATMALEVSDDLL